MICYLYPNPTYFIFAPDLPELLYYSHIPSIIIAILVGLFVFIKAPKELANRLLLLICLSFSCWVILSLLVWAGNDATLFAFIWPFFSILSAFMAIFSVYFAYVFAYKKDAGRNIKFIFLALLLPVLLLAHTDLSISGFNLAWCDAFQYEGQIFKLYVNFLGFLAVAWIAAILIHRYRRATPDFKKQLLLMGVGLEFFLASFITIVFIVTELTALGLLSDSRLEFYGLFGMTFFMVMMGILIVKFNSFNVGMHAANALVIALLILVASQYTYSNSTTTTVILTTITFVLTATAGLYLIRSVKHEIKQRKEIEELAKKLAKANNRLRELDKMKSEFVSIASHQLRSPLTSIRGYASMILEGSYGKVPQKAEEAVQRIADSSASMATSVEDYLNVSRIEAGNMKYELIDFNLKDEASKVVDDKRREAVKKGLLLTFKSNVTNHGIVNADIGKVRQILHNLINNSLKYTPHGSIEVKVTDDTKAKKLYVAITDTGIGIAPDDIESVFGKFQRAKNGTSVNATGNGLGLFIARKMATDMGGDITVTSPGPDHGSTFTLVMPLQM